MNPWVAKALVLTGTVAIIAIRAPHGHRSRIVKVATSYKTPLETGLLVLAWVGFFVPLIWIASPVFSFAEYALGIGPLKLQPPATRTLPSLSRVAEWPLRAVIMLPVSAKAPLSGL